MKFYNVFDEIIRRKVGVNWQKNINSMKWEIQSFPRKSDKMAELEQQTFLN